jgi:hypothetical protein
MLKTPVPFHFFRLVLIILRMLNLAFLLLGYFHSPYWLVLCGVQSIGMLAAGILGYCSLLKLPPHCPWNKERQK